ncbi:MAG: hypothetical protein ABIT96_07555 [Ferruginibacter sp.]
MTLLLEPGEIKKDTWAIQYISPACLRYNGKLTITNRRLVFTAKLNEYVNQSIADVLLEKDVKENLLVIIKADIKDLKVENNQLSKKAIVILNDGSRHTFNYGSLNIDRLVDAIHDNLP